MDVGGGDGEAEGGGGGGDGLGGGGDGGANGGGDGCENWPHMQSWRCEHKGTMARVALDQWVFRSCRLSSKCAYLVNVCTSTFLKVAIHRKVATANRNKQHVVS